MTKNVVYTILNGGVEDRRLGRLTLRNGQAVPNLSKPDFFCLLPFHTVIYGSAHDITFAHNGLKQKEPTWW